MLGSWSGCSPAGTAGCKRLTAAPTSAKAASTGGVDEAGERDADLVAEIPDELSGNAVRQVDAGMQLGRVPEHELLEVL